VATLAPIGRCTLDAELSFAIRTSHVRTATLSFNRNRASRARLKRGFIHMRLKHSDLITHGDVLLLRLIKFILFAAESLMKLNLTVETLFDLANRACNL
jgi:hypothetical protein